MTGALYTPAWEHVQQNIILLPSTKYNTPTYNRGKAQENYLCALPTVILFHSCSHPARLNPHRQHLLYLD